MKNSINGLCQIQRFDSLGGLAVSHEEGLDNLLANFNPTKTTYYVSRKDSKRLNKLQENFDKLHIPALTITEGTPTNFGPTELPLVVIKKDCGEIEGYPNVHIEKKNHVQICMVKDINDPTFVAISKFIDKNFCKMTK